jgi:hypothetical protein
MDINRLKKGYTKWVESSAIAISDAEVFLFLAICIYFESKSPHLLLVCVLNCLIWMVHSDFYNVYTENHFI